MKDHVIICGFGNIGFRTFELLNQAKIQVTVISDVPHDERRWQLEEAGGIFILGDARNDQVLIQAGIKHAQSIIALTDQDMVNVSIAMDSRNLNPHIKIILRMFDTQLGKFISNAYNVHQVFSASELASPIFVSQVYENSVLGQFTINEHNYYVYEDKIHNNKMSSEDPFVLAVIPYSNSENSTVLRVKSSDKYKRKLPKLFVWLKKINYLRSPVFSNFRRFLRVLLFVILFSTLIIMWRMSLSFVDSLYFVTTTVTTVGYGDFNFSHSSKSLKIFGCFLMLFGAAALATLFSSITEILLSRRLPSLLGGRPVPKKDHVVVVGGGHIGHRVVSTLLEDQIPIVVVENEENLFYAEDLKRQVALVEGDPRSADTLDRANVDTAKVLLMITEDDIKNLSVSLAAKKINPKIINIIQMFNWRLVNRLKTALSLDRVVSESDIAAAYFAASVFGGEILLALHWRDKLVFISRNGPDNAGGTPLVLDGKKYPNIFVHIIQ